MNSFDASHPGGRVLKPPARLSGLLLAGVAGVAGLALVGLAGCDFGGPNASQPGSAGTPAPGGASGSTPGGVPGQGFTLTSAAFADGSPVPREYTCEGQDASPALQWDEPPAGTRGFALIMDDPDAPGGTWVHWVLYGLPAATRSLPRGMPTSGTLPDTSRQGRNSFGKLGYGGPCPPRGGGAHRYFFKLYALDTALNIPSGATASQVQAALNKHVLATAQLMGTYSR